MKKINLLLVAFLLSVTSASAVDYTLTLKSSNCSSSRSFSVESGSSVTLDAKPDIGHAFKQWDDGNTENPRVVKLTQDTTFKAIFRVYNDIIQILLRGNYGNYNQGSLFYCPFYLYVYTVQASTDELAIPACGRRNWLDQGIYIQMMQHNWNASNPIFESCWKYCYNIIHGCNVALGNASISADEKAKLRLLRAYAYYRLLDLFGSVPVVTEETRIRPSDSSRSEVFSFVETELNDAIMRNLPVREYGSIDKGVLHTLKARLYLNSKVFLGLEDGSDEYNAYLEKCIAECDSVINSGQYSIAPNIYSNFYYDNGPGSSPENIFVIQYNNDGSTLGNLTQMASYYKTQGATFGAEMYLNTTGGLKLNPGKTADDPNATFNIFSKYDNRRLSILWGQQYNKITGEKILDDDYMYDKDKKTPINYTTFFDRGMDESAKIAGKEGLENCAFNGDGARIIKFELEANPQYYESGVDMVVMRYAEVLYMKAEALIRLGRGTEAVPLFKEVLQYRGYNYDNIENDAVTLDGKKVKYDYTKDEGKDATWACALMSKRWLKPENIEKYVSGFIPAEPDLEFMDQELRREFIWEDHRRTDMIRMGKFITGTWGGHLTPTLDKSKEVFPQPTDNSVPLLFYGIRVDVMANDNEKGIVSGGGYCEKGETVVISATPNAGYEFVKWQDGITANPRTVTVSQDTLFVAVFQPRTFVISAKPNISSAGTVSGGGSYKYKEEAALSATTNFGYKFDRWNDGVTATTRNITVLGDASYIAMYSTLPYEISIMVNDETLGDVAGMGIYEYNKVATLLAMPSAGNHFVQWSDGSRENPHYVKVLGDKMYIATFATGASASEARGETSTNDGVAVTPFETKAEFSWPSITGVASYSLVIWADEAQGKRVCTLTFNANGQLTNIDFTQSVKPQGSASAGGLNFTVTGLKPSTTYGYTLDAKDAEDDMIETKHGTFTTMGASGIADITAAGINIYTEGRTIIVENAADAITVSDALGRVVGKDDAQIVPAETRKFPVPSSGVYVVKIGNRAASVLVR